MSTTGSPSSGPDSTRCMRRRPVSMSCARIPRDYLAMAPRSRVLLSHPTEADEEEFLARMRASRELHRPWLYPPLTPADYRRYLATLGERKIGYLGRRREDGALIGYANVGEIVRGSLQGAFLGYGGAAEFAGQGYITELLQLVLRDAFTPLRLHPLGG